MGFYFSLNKPTFQDPRLDYNERLETSKYVTWHFTPTMKSARESRTPPLKHAQQLIGLQRSYCSGQTERNTRKKYKMQTHLEPNECVNIFQVRFFLSECISCVPLNVFTVWSVITQFILQLHFLKYIFSTLSHTCSNKI